MMPSPDQLAILIPIIALMIPIVKIMTSHQQRMAELVHRDQMQQHTYETDQMRKELMEIKQLLHDQAIAIVNLRALQTRSAPVSEGLQERLESHI